MLSRNGRARLHYRPMHAPNRPCDDPWNRAGEVGLRRTIPLLLPAGRWGAAAPGGAARRRLSIGCAWAAVALGIAGCASGEPPPRTLLDPGNPEAAEGAPAFTTPAAPKATAVAQPTTGARVFACPMHPDIVRDAPGVCPKCGMTLVKADR